MTDENSCQLTALARFRIANFELKANSILRKSDIRNSQSEMLEADC